MIGPLVFPIPVSAAMVIKLLWWPIWAVAQHDQGGNDNSKTDAGLDDNARHNGSNDITGYNTDDSDVPPSTTPT